MAHEAREMVKATSGEGLWSTEHEADDEYGRIETSSSKRYMDVRSSIQRGCVACVLLIYVLIWPSAQDARMNYKQVHASSLQPERGRAVRAATKHLEALMLGMMQLVMVYTSVYDLEIGQSCENGEFGKVQ